MKKNAKNNNRRDFLMNVCPTVAMAFLGITVLDSCSSGDDDSDYGYGNGSNNNNNNGSGNNNTGQGYTVSGSTVTIDLNHAMFSTLHSNNWINFTDQNMLILKINSSLFIHKSIKPMKKGSKPKIPIKIIILTENCSIKKLLINLSIILCISFGKLF